MALEGQSSTRDSWCQTALQITFQVLEARPVGFWCHRAAAGPFTVLDTVIIVSWAEQCSMLASMLSIEHASVQVAHHQQYSTYAECIKDSCFGKWKREAF